MQEKSKTLAPKTVNQLRTFILVAINFAKRAGKFEGENPARDVKPRRVPRRLYEYLRAEEVPRVLEKMDERHPPIFATAIYTGLRKGELFGLRKSDVDLKMRLLCVMRSHERDTTKGRHADAIPIALDLIPYLEQAILASPSELIFPNNT